MRPDAIVVAIAAMGSEIPRRSRLNSGSVGGVPEIKCDPRLADVAQPQLRILGQTPPQRANEVWRRARGQEVPIGLSCDDRFQRTGHRGAGKRRLSRAHPEQHAAECPDVRALVHGQSRRLLRAHVTRGSDDGTNLRRVAGAARRAQRRDTDLRVIDFREPEVEDLDVSVGRDLDVAGLEITMDDAAIVRRLQSLGELTRDPATSSNAIGPAASRSSSVTPSTSSRTSATTPLALFHSVDGADVRVIQGGERTGLASKRDRRSGICANESGNTLIATAR